MHVTMSEAYTPFFFSLFFAGSEKRDIILHNTPAAHVQLRKGIWVCVNDLLGERVIKPRVLLIDIAPQVTFQVSPCWQSLLTR